MQKINLNTAAPNIVGICVDGSDSNDVWGRIYHCYSDEAVLFDNGYQILQKLEGLMDDLNYPQSSVKLRTFKEDACKERKKVKKVMKDDEVIRQMGKKGTFVVHVMYRQNATWQGEVVWTENGEVRKFRSALELLKLMDSAMDSNEMQQDSGG